MSSLAQRAAWALLLAGAAWPAPRAAGAEEAPQAETPQQRADIERQIQRLRSESWEEREAATRALIKLGQAALPHLARVSSEDDAELAWRLGRIRRAAGAEPGARAAASLSTLAAMYDRQPAGQRAEFLQSMVALAGAELRPWLIEKLPIEPDGEAQAVMARALGWMGGGPAAARALKAVYSRGESSEALRGQILIALAQQDPQEALPLSRAALRSEFDELRGCALDALVQLLDRESLPEVRKLAGGGAQVNKTLQVQALDALLGLLDDRAGDLFISALKDTDPLVASAALGGVAALRPAGAAPALIELLKEEAKREDVSELSHALFSAIGILNDASFVEPLREILRKGPARLKPPVLGALARMRAVEAVPEITVCLGDAMENARSWAAQAAAAVGLKHAVPQLKALSASAHLGLPAVRALLTLDEEAGRQALMAALDGGEPWREAAAGLAEEWRIQAALPKLRELATAGSDGAMWAVVALTCDDQTARLLLKPFVARRLGELRGGASEGSEMLAMALARMDLYEQSAKFLEEVGRRALDPDMFLSRLANMYHETGRYADCETAYSRWGALAAGNPTYLNNRAWFYCTAFRKEYLRPEVSLSLARRALAREPDAAHVVDTHGWALHVCGRYEEAVTELTRSLEMREPGDRPGRAWERTRIARSLWAAGRKDEALAQAAKAVEEAPDDPKVWFEAAGFYAWAGRRDEAVHALHKAVETGFKHTAALELNPEFDALRGDAGYTHALRLAHKNRARLEKILAEVEAEVRSALSAGGTGPAPQRSGEPVEGVDDGLGFTPSE